jgi:hypothetical protein
MAAKETVTSTFVITLYSILNTCKNKFKLLQLFEFYPWFIVACGYESNPAPAADVNKHRNEENNPWYMHAPDTLMMKVPRGPKNYFDV